MLSDRVRGDKDASDLQFDRRGEAGEGLRHRSRNHDPSGGRKKGIKVRKGSGGGDRRAGKEGEKLRHYLPHRHHDRDSQSGAFSR